MFNNKLKKEAIRIHEETLGKYNSAYETMTKSCENLYSVRSDAVELIKLVERVINSIANTPKEFEAGLEKVKVELEKFKDTKEIAKKNYEELKAGVNIVGGTVAGLGVAAMGPTALMSIATTFGTASTGTAISALSGAAAQKAAVAWIGRTFAKIAVTEGAGMAAGEAFLALAGPIGWVISATTVGTSLMSLSKKNKTIADEAVKEVKEIAKAKEALDEITAKIDGLCEKTKLLYEDINSQRDKIIGYMNLDYHSSTDDDRYALGALVNNTLSLSRQLNLTIG